MADSKHTPGILLLIQRETGDMVACHKGEGDIARALILDGYDPVGPKGKAAAAIIRAKAEGRS